MKKPIQSLPPIIRMIIMIISALLVIVSCSQNNAPTAGSPATENSVIGNQTTSAQITESANPGMWNPMPGDGYPLLNDRYWSDLGGSLDGRNSRESQDCSGCVSQRMRPSDGGTLYLGAHWYYIPPNALSQRTEMTLCYASCTGVGVDCGPSPLHFNIPVILHLSYSGLHNSDGSPVNPDDLRILYMDPDGNTQALLTYIDSNTQTLWALVDHFSRYVIG